MTYMIAIASQMRSTLRKIFTNEAGLTKTTDLLNTSTSILYVLVHVDGMTTNVGQVVLIVTRDALVDFIMQNGVKSEADRARCIREAYEQTKADPLNEEKRLFLQTLCRRILEKAAFEQETRRYGYHQHHNGTVYPREPSDQERPEDDLVTTVIDAMADRPQQEISDILLKAIELTNMSAQTGVEKIVRVMPVVDFEPFSQSFLEPGIGLNYCEALLRGFQAKPGDRYAVSRIPVIVQAVMRELKSDGIARTAPIVRLLHDSLKLEPNLCDGLIDAMIGSPAMRRRHGIPALFDAQFGVLNGIAVAQPPPSQREKLESFLSSVLMNYFVFEVGRPPQRYPTLNRSICYDLQKWPQGKRINRFLQDPNQLTFISTKWTGQMRDNIIRVLEASDANLSVAIDKIRSGTASTLQLHLRKVDYPCDNLLKTWVSRYVRYQEMLKQTHALGFLKDSKYTFLQSGDWRYMESLVLPQGPLLSKRFFIGLLSTTTPDELTRMIEQQGGRVVAIEDIDGPDVVGINGPQPLSYERNVLRYWQPKIVHEYGMLRDLQEMANAIVHTGPGQHQTTTEANERKRKADHLEPLAENSNLAGQNKRPMTNKEVEIVDLMDD
ncbi:hypothetical protein LTS07_006584 [Exophiala sideris]|uniref:BRCT domain-containing protein n=1 Tax=Exophiala sideris TaxID=1016849 RepID=A0ABR0J5J6_9EURO|nr:hypothetical protein LTS07_006584 [Exophiala sideris]KAK5035865.1 hypothetical protein LTR13_005435 [Exophiala sideris]KAK5056901.1 hypothetical protein LTR69_007539 [Exophiala sideris]KAK5181308.1 hypothetical protein LTR44_006103 [Eurotiomycetes sp. CCFEE 6388]